MNRGWRAVICVGMLAVAGAAQAEERWDTALTGPITVRTRTLEGTSVKEVWAEAELGVSVADVQAALTEPERLPAFLPHLKEAYTVKRRGPNVEWVYNYVEPPLVGARDYVTEVTLLEGVKDDGSGRFHQRWRAVEGVRPERAGTLRIKLNEGSWFVTPLPDGRCKVVYRLKLDPGGWVPAFITQMATVQAVPDTLRAVEREAQRRAEARLLTRAVRAPRPGAP
ncbi:MAG: hypothetical protein L0Y66_18415 [Myxococcaceae bacterium]|nr:hypothetical protein [Myxococcaceae bacterium]